MEEEVVATKPEPYMTKTVTIRIWNPDFDQDAVCARARCGHLYYRHFDSYDDMAPCGCKYCPCYTFKEAE